LPAVASSAATSTWKVIKGKHFLVYYTGDSAFPGKVSSKAEEYYKTITGDLGFERYDNFWLWEDRVKIFIYKSREDFASAVGAPDWAIGKAVSERREIHTFSGDETFVDSVLPHEMTHIVFREFIGFKGEIPLWLHEGVAQWEEPAKRSMMAGLAKRLAAGNLYIPLNTLTRMGVKDLIAGGNAGHFYTQAMSLVGFMIEKHGSGRFRIFCGHLRDGRPMEEALRLAYPQSLGNIAELEKSWKKHVMEQLEARK